MDSRFDRPKKRSRLEKSTRDAYISKDASLERTRFAELLVLLMTSENGYVRAGDVCDAMRICSSCMERDARSGRRPRVRIKHKWEERVVEISDTHMWKAAHRLTHVIAHATLSLRPKLPECHVLAHIDVIPLANKQPPHLRSASVYIYYLLTATRPRPSSRPHRPRPPSPARAAQARDPARGRRTCPGRSARPPSTRRSRPRT